MTHAQETRPHDHEGHAAPKEAWDAIADGYDRFVTPREGALASKALRLAGLRAGERFLDVAAGTGGLSIPAGQLGADVVATDWSSEMIRRFEVRVREAGLTNAEGRVMDCHALAFPPDTFDVTGSQFGVMLVENQPLALREMARVTRPGGRVLLVTYGDPARFEALQLFLAALRAAVPDFEGLPGDPPPLEFQTSDPAVLRQRLLDAGLGQPLVDADHLESLELTSGQELWAWCMGSNPIPGMLVADLTERQKDTVRTELDKMIAERAHDQGAAVLTAAINIAVATK